MYCPNCGTGNPDGVAFCTGCGMALGASAPQAQPVAAPVAPQPAAPVVAPAAAAPQPTPAPVAAPQPAPQQPVAAPQPQPQAQAQPKQPSSMLPFGDHFKNLFKAALHPVTGPAEIAPKYDKIGNAIFLAAIVIVICSVVGCITSLSVDLYYVIRYGASSSTVGIILKDIFFPFFYYALRTFGFAGLMLVAGLIVKEKWSFPRLLAVVSLAVAPAYIVRDLIGTYFSLIPYVGSLVSYAATAYYLFMLYEGLGAETKLTGNKKVFVLVAVYAVVGIIAGIFSF